MIITFFFCLTYLQTRCGRCFSTNTSQRSFSSKYSKHHKSQTNRARDLKVLHDAHHLSCVICDVSDVTCHLSHVTCQVSNIFIYIYFLFLQMVELVDGGSFINGAYPVLFIVHLKLNLSLTVSGSLKVHILRLLMLCNFLTDLFALLILLHNLFSKSFTKLRFHKNPLNDIQNLVSKYELFHFQLKSRS